MWGRGEGVGTRGRCGDEGKVWGKGRCGAGKKGMEGRGMGKGVEKGGGGKCGGGKGFVPEGLV